MGLTMATSVESPKPRIRSTECRREIAILVPCLNEELTVGKTVAAFREALPLATIYVYDNNSTDRTIDVARAAGAVVRNEPRQGKGNVVRRMFADIDADVFVLVDGDATYEAEAAPRMVRRAIDENLDFVNGARVSRSMDAYRRGHRFGNYVLTAMVRSMFGKQFTDMLSGYKVFSRRYVKSFPAMSRGFEIETELTVHALELRMPSAEEFTAYGERPSGSEEQAQHLSRRGQDPSADLRSRAQRAPAGVFRSCRHSPHPCRGRARGSASADVFRNGARAPASDGRPQSSD